MKGNNIGLEAKKRAKELLKKAKKLNVIKPHTEAFKNNSPALEQHKGNLALYRK